MKKINLKNQIEMTKTKKISKEAKQMISIQESRAFIMKNLKKSYHRTEILKIIDREISRLKNPNEHVLILTIVKSKWKKVMKCIHELDKRI